MPGFSWTAGLLATGAFVTATAAAQQQVPVETRTATPTPYAACVLIKEEIDQNKPDKENNIKRYETCRIQAEAITLLRQGRSQEAMEVLSRTNKVRPVPQ